MTWWDNASTAQRLAQIDAGIECGMTTRQVAMASRTSISNIATMASRHGRTFPLKGGTPSQRRYGRILSDRAAYLRDERVNLWGEAPQDEPFLEPAEAE